MYKDTRDVSDILDHIEKATGEECLVAFGTLVAWGHINEGLIKRVKDMGKLDKLLRRIIETYENSDQEQKEYKMHIQVYNYTNNPARAPHLQRK